MKIGIKVVKALKKSGVFLSCFEPSLLDRANPSHCAEIIERETGVNELIASLTEFVEKFDDFDDFGCDSGNFQSTGLTMMLVRAKMALSKFKGE